MAERKYARMIERWKDIPGWEGYYQVSNLGGVQSLPRKNTRGYRMQGRVLRPTEMAGGHLQIRLSRGNKEHSRLVHRLVLLAFRGPCPQGMEGCHRNGNPADNRLTNLRWGTPSSNVLDSVRHGTHWQTRKTHCNKGHEYSADNTRIRRRGGRVCVECNRAYQRQWARDKAARLRAA